MAQVYDKKPESGQMVRVTVSSQQKSRMREILGLTPRRQNQTHSGMVVDLPWLRPDQFAMSTDDPRFPVRVISCDEVVAINGDPCEFIICDRDREVIIKSMNSPEQYTVKIIGGKPTSCTCKGFGFRRSCKHLQQAQQIQL